MENRSEPRIERDISIFVHVNSCEGNPDLVGVSISCKATDLSPHGLRFISDLRLPPESLVYVSISIEQPFSTYLLFSEVRWEFESDGKLVKGLQFLDTVHSDLKPWIEAFDSIFKEDSTTN